MKKKYITPTIEVLTAKVEKGYQLSSTPVGSSTSYEDALAEPILAEPMYGGATIVFWIHARTIGKPGKSQFRRLARREPYTSLHLETCRKVPMYPGIARHR